LEHFGTFWNIWNILEQARIIFNNFTQFGSLLSFSDILHQFGTFWNIWNILEPSRIFWNNLQHFASFSTTFIYYFFLQFASIWNIWNILEQFPTFFNNYQYFATFFDQFYCFVTFCNNVPQIATCVTFWNILKHLEHLGTI